jgi:hypothetical protein
MLCLHPQPEIPMKFKPVEPNLGPALLRIPPRRRLFARSATPGRSTVWVSPGPWRRLAWIFGFGQDR